MKSKILGASLAAARLLSPVLFFMVSASQSAFACSTDAGLEQAILRERLALFGEIHGTAEAPAVFSSAVCMALDQGLEVSVGLEFNRDQLEPLRVYLESDGDKPALERLLASPFWSRPMQDGRSSKAMLDTVERLRQLKHRQPKLSVFVLYEQPDPAAVATTPDEIMANRIRLERKKRPQALLLVLVGNYHSRLHAPGSMGDLLADLSPLSILLEAGGGSAWMCTPECTVHALAGLRDLPAISGTSYQPLDKDAAYSARMSIGAVTASPPAIQPLSKR